MYINHTIKSYYVDGTYLHTRYARALYRTYLSTKVIIVAPIYATKCKILINNIMYASRFYIHHKILKYLGT